MFCSAVAESAEGGGGCGGPKASEGAKEGVGALDSNSKQFVKIFTSARTKHIHALKKLLFRAQEMVGALDSISRQFMNIPF